MNKLAEYTHIPDSMRNEDSERIKGEMLQTGFIAQEVEESANSLGFDISGVDKPKNEIYYFNILIATKPFFYLCMQLIISYII